MVDNNCYKIVMRIIVHYNFTELYCVQYCMRIIIAFFIKFHSAHKVKCTLTVDHPQSLVKIMEGGLLA